MPKVQTHGSDVVLVVYRLSQSSGGGHRDSATGHPVPLSGLESRSIHEFIIIGRYVDM